MRRIITRGISVLALGGVVWGCTPTIPSGALQWKPETLALRQLQTRRYETTEEGKLLSASVGVLQDLGYNLDNSATDVGLVVTSKERDATETGQVVGATFLLLTAAGGTPQTLPIDENQKIYVSLVTRPGQKDESTLVRVTFRRVVWKTDKSSRSEVLTEPGIYQGFFEKLNKSVFLEGHSI